MGRTFVKSNIRPMQFCGNAIRFVACSQQMKPQHAPQMAAEAAIKTLRIAVREHLLKSGRGGGRELAAAAGLSPSVLSRFAKGDVEDVTLTTGVKLLMAMKGDITRALPDWPGDVDRNQPTTQPIEVLGQVQAGAVTMEGTHRYTVNIAPLSWRQSRYWTLTSGPVIFLEVEGDSMIPDYQPGALLACRAPVDSMGLPDATPCIFRDGSDGSTFKLFRRVKTRPETIVAEPLNKLHRLIPVTERTRIDYVVLGSIDLGR